MPSPPQNGSSLITQAALSLGYPTHLKSSPKAELLSTRSAAVRNSRSFQPNCCCPQMPSVVLTTSRLGDAGGAVALDTVSRPGAGKLIAASELALSCFRMKLAPIDELELTFGAQLEPGRSRIVAGDEGVVAQRLRDPSPGPPPPSGARKGAKSGVANRSSARLSSEVKSMPMTRRWVNQLVGRWLNVVPPVKRLMASSCRTGAGALRAEGQVESPVVRIQERVAERTR